MQAALVPPAVVTEMRTLFLLASIGTDPAPTTVDVGGTLLGVGDGGSVRRAFHAATRHLGVAVGGCGTRVCTREPWRRTPGPTQAWPRSTWVGRY
jgi:hypothetical protein